MPLTGSVCVVLLHTTYRVRCTNRPYILWLKRSSKNLAGARNWVAENGRIRPILQRVAAS